MHGYRDIFSKKTKIVATLGPASDSRAQIQSLIEAGANVFRLNMTHGTHNEHASRIAHIRSLAKEVDVPLAILADLSGPKIRFGDFETETVTLEDGKEFVLTTEKVIGTNDRVHVTYPKLPKEVSVGSTILVNDGNLILTVTGVSGKDVRCKIEVGGTIKGRRGVNIPGSKLSMRALTDKDKKDISFCLKQGVDFLALSFARTANDVKALRELTRGHLVGIITKIETKDAVENFEELLEVSDGIIVARGDLSVETPLEQVPVIQKRIIKRCNEQGIAVITATQMLGSMVNSKIPTRAEVNDIANAIYDGTDALMLSEETAIGSYPTLAVKTMSKVAVHTEKNLPYEELLKHHPPRSVTGSIGFAVVHSAHHLNAKAIVALSASGTTARLIARYRPNRPIIVITDNEKTHNKIVLSFNCYPVLFKKFNNIFDVISSGKKLLLDNKVLSSGDLLIFAAGIPLAEAGNTNTMMIQKA